VATSARVRRTQEERRESTRRVVLDATVQSLLELGYAKTTTLEVQRRAGLSRGALLHHFPSKAELMADAVRYLAVLRGKELHQLAVRLPDGVDRVDAGIDLLWESFTGPLFHVALELRGAARTDPELRDLLVDVERELRDNIVAQCRELFGDEIAGRDGFERAIDTSLQLMIGASMSAMLHREPERARELLKVWKSLFPRLLEKEI